jgi:hypothetical protein
VKYYDVNGREIDPNSKTLPAGQYYDEEGYYFTHLGGAIGDALKGGKFRTFEYGYRDGKSNWFGLVRVRMYDRGKFKKIPLTRAGAVGLAIEGFLVSTVPYGLGYLLKKIQERQIGGGA